MPVHTSRHKASVPSFRFSLLLLFSLFSYPSHAQKHFETWFPQYREYFEGVVQDNCSTEVAVYLHGHPPASCHGRPGCLASNTVNCILTNSRQSVLANTNSAAVVLGVMPSTLGFIGTSTVEIGLLFHRRPLLAILLSAGSPAVSPVRTLDYRGPREILHRCLRGKHILFGSANSPFVPSWVIVSAQYVLALAAIVNVAHLSYLLSVQTVCSFNPESEFQPAVWAGLSLPIHILGTWAVWLRVSITVSKDRNGNTGDTPYTTLFSLARRLLPAQELRLCAHQASATVHGRTDSLLLVAVSWATATGTVMHIMYGTLIFSSLLFISAKDAIVVVIRYVASMVVCRAILMMEISGLGNVLEIGNE